MLNLMLSNMGIVTIGITNENNFNALEILEDDGRVARSDAEKIGGLLNLRLDQRIDLGRWDDLEFRLRFL